MRPLLVLFGVALLSMSAGACGGSGGHPDSSSATDRSASLGSGASTSSIPEYARVDGDKDNDIGAPYDDSNNNAALDYARAASPADRQAVAALVRHYYEVALQGNGSMACSMILSSLAEGVAEDYGEGSAGPSYLKSGTTCPAVVTLLFKHFHAQLTVEVPKLEVKRVRLAGHRGYAILGFGSLPEREIPVGLEARKWKIEALLDSELP